MNLKLLLSAALFFILTAIEVEGQDSISIANEAHRKLNLAKETGDNSVGIEREKELLIEAAKMFKSINDWSNHIYSLCVLASYNYQQGRFIEWNIYMDSVDQIAPLYLEEYGEFDLTYKSLKARQLIQNGEIAEVIQMLNEVLSKPEFLTNDFLKISFVEKLTQAYEMAGDFENAKGTIFPGISMIDHPLNKGRALAQLARIYSKEKDYENCLITISESLKYLDTINTNESFRLELQRRYIDKAEYLLMVDQADSCLYYVDYALNLQGGVPKDLEARCQIVKAKALHKKGDLPQAYDKALKGYEALKSAQPLNSQLNLSTAEGAFVLNDILVAQKNLTESESLLLDALKEVGVGSLDQLKKQIHTHNYTVVVKILSALSKTKIELFNLTQESIYLDAALELQKDIFYVLAHLRKNNLDKSYLNFWAKENQRLYEDAIQICLLAEEPELAFAFMEENKSNLLAKSMNEQEARGDMYISSKLLTEEKSHIRKLHVLRLELEALLKQPNLDDEELVELGDKINAVQIKLNGVQNQIKNQNPEYYNLIYNDQLLSLKELQMSLDDQSAVIEYFMGDEISCVASVTRNALQIHTIHLQDKQLENLQQLSLFLLNVRQSLAENEMGIQGLSATILDSLIDDLPEDVSNLTIIPDDILINFPFEILLDGEGRMLLEKYNIHYEYSARMLLMLKSRDVFDYSFDLTAYAYGGDEATFTALRNCSDVEQASLVCADKEISSIKANLENRVMKTEIRHSSEIFEAAKNSKILHLATHSCLDEKDVNKSRIFFDDEVLTLYDIQNLNLPSELTVLSSCESGFGKVIKGEGGMSISKAFIQSGSNSTLVSLWPVDDCTTSDLMGSFYKNLNTGMKKNEALRIAKLKYLETAHPSRLHPFYWAGFVLVGNERAVWPVDSMTFQKVVGFGFILCILIIAILLIYRRFKTKR